MRNTMNSVEIREKGEGLEIGHPVPLFTFRPSPRVYRLGLIDYESALTASASFSLSPLTKTIVP